MTSTPPGLETAILEASRSAWHYVFGWRYHRIFGSEAAKGRLHLIYGLLDPPEARGSIRLPRATYLQEA